ncbi:MAG: hypothetical protein ABI977_14165, partial [Acidobacteriota bacterium]
LDAPLPSVGTHGRRIRRNVSAAAFHAPSEEEQIVKKLYPDQATFKREEQRRFEILIAHWDVPLVAVE